MCEDSEMDWRLALGDFESNSRMIQKEKEKYHELNFFQNSEKKKIMNNHYISDEKENINTKIDGRILVMNKDIQVSFSEKKNYVLFSFDVTKTSKKFFWSFFILFFVILKKF